MPTSELPRKVGRKKASQKQSALVLLFVERNYADLENLLRKHGYTVVVPSTADQAVALCPNNRFVAAVIDRKSLAEDNDWSLAQSLKMVSRDVPVILLVPESAQREQEPLPSGVDNAVSNSDPLQVLEALRRYLRGREKQRAS